MTQNGTPATPIFTQCPGCKERRVVSTATHTVVGAEARDSAGVPVYHACPVEAFPFPAGMDRVFHVKGLKATLAPEKRCDGKCANSGAPVCKCSCGGAAHGVGLIPTQITN